MGMPETRYEMRRAMYEFTGTAKCKGCGAAIEWWVTPYNKKKLPIDILPGDSDVSVVRPHWVSCPKAKDFRKPAAAPTAAQGKAPVAANAPGQPERLQRLIETTRESTGARVIVAVYDDLTTFSYRQGVPPEDLRNDLIGAANAVRNHSTRGEE